MVLRMSMLVAALAAVAGCTATPSVLQCDADPDCGQGNLCLQGACAANAPPVASFEAPAEPTTHRLVNLVPASSDPEGRAVVHLWSVEATADGCAPDAEAVGAALEVVFWCAGTYRVTLVPVDDLGAAGASVVRTFEVTAATGAPAVTAGAPLAATHTCDLTVPSCLVIGPGGALSLQLGAVAEDPGGGPVDYEWVAVPPPDPAKDPALLVTFVTASHVAAPIVAISNGSGGPIAGTYRFRVRARTPLGLLGQAYQVVTVANGAPTVTPPLLALPHAFAGGRYVAEGDLPSGATDPEGDALFATGAFDGGSPADCLEEIAPAATGGALHVRISCASATSLVGDAPRTLSATVTDANGAAVAFTSPLIVENRPPEVILAPAFADGRLRTDHRVEPCRLAEGGPCFVSDGPDPFLARDPDGDPLGDLTVSASVDGSRTASKGSVSLVDGSTRFRFETPVPRPLEFRAPSGATGFVVSGSVADPFGARTTFAAPVIVGNRPPALVEPSLVADVQHVYDAARKAYVATAPGPVFEDPDGDPLIPSVAPAGSCTFATIEAGRSTIHCERAWDFTSGTVPPLAAFLTAGRVHVTALDGWEGANASTYVTILDRPTTAALGSTSIERCACMSWGDGTATWVLGTLAAVPLVIGDPDGDPAVVVVSTPSDDPGQASSTCLPGACSAPSNVTNPGSTIVSVVVNPGAGGPLPALGATIGVYCSRTGTSCL